MLGAADISAGLFPCHQTSVLGPEVYRNPGAALTNALAPHGEPGQKQIWLTGCLASGPRHNFHHLIYRLDPPACPKAKWAVHMCSSSFQGLYLILCQCNQHWYPTFDNVLLWYFSKLVCLSYKWSCDILIQRQWIPPVRQAERQDKKQVRLHH